MQFVVLLQHLTKVYQLGENIVPALQHVSLEIAPGVLVAVRGPSGSGKSTLLNLIGCLDRPTAGDYWLMGRHVNRLTPNELAALRNQGIGFIFQNFNLLPRLSALKNIMISMTYAGYVKSEQEERAWRALELVGLADRAHHLPAQMSGGEQQRVAIARALVNQPALILADEPTGNLDSRTSLEIMALLQALNQRGHTIVVVTHNPEIAVHTRRQIVLHDGQVLRDEAIENPRSARQDWQAARAGMVSKTGLQVQEEKA
jgi:putative ABC transport system ATP-binding protein